MWREGGGGRMVRVGLFLAGGLVLILVLAQVFLPGIAANQIKGRVARYGTVQSVSVSAWPAVKLLWGSVDSVTVRARSLKVSLAQTAKLLWEARGVSDMKLTASSAQAGSSLRLSDLSFSKRGKGLTLQARLTDADMRAALPEGFGVQLLGSEGGKVEIRASGGVFGVGAAVDAVASASDGKLVAQPQGFLLGGLQLTLFSEPHIYVEGVGARVEKEQPLTYRLTLVASLR
jgi:hypothetical protein